MYAARNERVEATTILLESGADINAKTIWGLTAVDLCVRYSCLRMLDFLLFQYDDGNDGHGMYNYASREGQGQEILHQAATYGNSSVIKMLIRVHESGKALLDINHKDCIGKTAMDYALQRGDQQICDLFEAFFISY
jgi:ankyrin repeat protein